MRAIIQDRYGAPEQVLKLQEIERPPLREENVLIRVRATSVNTPDWATVAGIPYVLRLRSGLRRPPNPVRGTDVAGIVEAVGARVSDLRPGDEVFGSLWDGTPTVGGAFAEFAAVAATQVSKKPAGLTFEEAAGSVMSGLTALLAMRDVGKVGLGTRVLINGASGGVGTFAVQIAAALGAEVTGVCSTRNLDLVRSLGAAKVIDYTREGLGGRYDVILDNVLNHPPKAMARLLAADGVFIPNSLGNTGGLFAALPRMARAARLGRFVRCVVDRDNLRALAAYLESGAVRVVVDRAYPLREAGAAVSHMLGHHAVGKVVITV